MWISDFSLFLVAGTYGPCSVTLDVFVHKDFLALISLGGVFQNGGRREKKAINFLLQ